MTLKAAPGYAPYDNIITVLEKALTKANCWFTSERGCATLEYEQDLSRLRYGG